MDRDQCVVNIVNSIYRLNSDRFSHHAVDRFCKTLKILNNNYTIAKVIPENKIGKFLLFSKGLSGFFMRFADINELLENSTDIYKTLFERLRLDYVDSNFNKSDDKFMGLIITRIPNFGLRVPVDLEYVEYLGRYNKKIIESKEYEPNSGIYITAHSLGIPEFFVSISNYKDGLPMSTKNKDEFPTSAFNVDFKLIQRNAEIIDFASYDSGDFETSGDDHFIINKKHSDIAIKYGWECMG